MPGRPVLTLPGCGTLRGVAVSLPELWRSRQALNSVEGVDLTAANALLGVVGDGSSEGAAGGAAGAASGVPVMPYAVWQCGGGYEEVSERFDLLKFDFGGAVADVAGEATVVATPTGGTCHALVYWMEYGFGCGTDGGEPVVSGAPPAGGRPGPSEQAVQLLSAPLVLQPGQRLHVEAKFDASEGNVEFDIGWS